MIGTRTLGGYRCPVCQSYSPEYTIRRNQPTFRLYFNHNHRNRTVISSAFMLTIGYFTVYLGFIQYQQSSPILLPKWNRLLVTFIIMYLIVFLSSTIIGLTYLRVDYKKWSQNHPNLLICPTCLSSFEPNPVQQLQQQQQQQQPQAQAQEQQQQQQQQQEQQQSQANIPAISIS